MNTGVVFELREITTDYKNMDGNAGSEVKVIGLIKSPDVKKNVGFDPRKIQGGINVGQKVEFVLSNRSTEDKPWAFRVVPIVPIVPIVLSERG